MKKLGLLVMPLMAISLLASCGGSTTTYKVSVGTADHLLFTTINGKPLDRAVVKKNQDFTFEVKAYNDANSDHYVVPSILNISINGMEPLVDGYKVQTPGEDESEVTINANKIIGNIVISGNAVNNEEFHYQVSSHYGLEAIESGTVSKKSTLTLTFTPEGTYSKPKAENIYIQFDDVPDTEDKKKWISPADDGVGDEYCSYDEETGDLTIKTNHILNSINIKARANDYELLNSLTWGKINELSLIGAAPYVFYMGEEKTVDVNTKIHTVRIIGFNHDYSELPDEGDPDPNKVLGITFEFVNVITNANGDAVSTPWHNSNYDYRDSTFNKFLNNDILNMLPSSDNPDNPYLRDVIKTVDKKVGVYGGSGHTATSFDGGTHPYPYLFALAHDEMTDHADRTTTGEGVRYQYYKNNVQDDRVKKPVGSIYPKEYWLRSPYADYGSDFVWHVRSNGRLMGDNHDNAFAVAPAFCI